MDIDAKRNELKNAASASLSVYLASDNSDNFMAWSNAELALKLFNIDFPDTIKLSASRLNSIMERSVFGTVDKIRATKKVN